VDERRRRASPRPSRADINEKLEKLKRAYEAAAGEIKK
jgi:hypothetical protein